MGAAGPSEIVLFRSADPGACLTHIKRDEYVYMGDLFMRAHCSFSSPTDPNHRAHGKVIDVRSEMFVCERCERLARKRGVAVPSLIPTSGCSASGGRWNRG